MFGLGRLWRGGEGVGYMFIRFYVHESWRYLGFEGSSGPAL